MSSIRIIINMSISAVVGAADRVNTASATNSLPSGWISRPQFFRIKAASSFQSWTMPFNMYASALAGTLLKKSLAMVSHRWLIGVLPQGGRFGEYGGQVVKEPAQARVGKEDSGKK